MHIGSADRRSERYDDLGIIQIGIEIVSGLSVLLS